ncbi:MAG: ROK family protein [Lachnospiraceae bacterium]|nr:ROK family protein [Lachnospiraceae bacterium]
MKLGALEAGGTKMVCAIGDETGKVFERISIPTKTPQETMPEMIAYFREKQIDALGIGCFGPIDPDPKSETYGYITSTPKLAWQNFNIVEAFKEALGCPVGFDTDVNASALGEATFGITKGLDCSMYLTVGTGIGAGIYINGELLHGMMHPEAGHILLQRHPQDSYGGKCPFHGNCFEGLAAGPAIEERWGKKAVQLADRPEVWEMEAFYIAQALVNYTMIFSPMRIVLGGGVMHQSQLFALIREKYKELMAGYIRTKELEDLDSYIVPYSLGDNQGIMGCLQLAVWAESKYRV